MSLKIIYDIYFVHSISPLSAHPSSSPPSYPPNFILFLSQNQKKIKTKTPIYQNKSTHIIKTWNPFCVGCLFLRMGSAPNVVDISSDISLEKTKFSFLSSHQLLIVSWLAAELRIHFPFSVMGICLFLYAWVLYLLSQSLCIILLDVEGDLLIGSSTISGFTVFLPALLLVSPSLNNEDLRKIECSTVSHVLSIVWFLGFCIDPHLLQEASLMEAEQCSVWCIGITICQ